MNSDRLKDRSNYWTLEDCIEKWGLDDIDIEKIRVHWINWARFYNTMRGYDDRDTPSDKLSLPIQQAIMTFEDAAHLYYKAEFQRKWKQVLDGTDTMYMVYCNFDRHPNRNRESKGESSGSDEECHQTTATPQ